MFPDVKFIPTGGVTAENLGDYLSVPSVLACGGTWITAQLDGIEERARVRRRRRRERPSSAESCRYDLVALGEVMLRFDPGDGRIATTRTFSVSEGGGEYNVARGLRRCFGMRTAIVTAFADNPVGRLLEDLILQGGVDQSYISWVPYDGVGRGVRNGLNFVERGFGVRAALGCSDRGHSAASTMQPGDVDWDGVFGRDGARWFHCGGIFAALSSTAAALALEAMTAARRHGAVVSFDLNYRPSLWHASGGTEAAADDEPPPRRAGRRAPRERGGLLGRARLLGDVVGDARRSTPTRDIHRRVLDDYPKLQLSRRRCARRTPRRSTTGAGSAARARRSSSGPRCAGSRSSTASAAETPSPQG